MTVVGCGGGGNGGSSASDQQVVRGNGYVFSAPAGWEVTRSPISIQARPQDDRVALVAVYRLRTAKPYRPSLWRAAAAELDRKAALLATELHGHIASKTTTGVDGRRAREYVFDYGDRRARISFLYRRALEYELYCRWQARGTEPSACDLLAKSFRLS